MNNFWELVHKIKADTVIILFIIAGAYAIIAFVRIPEVEGTTINDILMITIGAVIRGIYDNKKHTL